MIERYTLEPMGSLWNKPDARYGYWLKIAKAIVWAKARLGLVPQEARAVIQKHANFSVERIRELEAQLDHDVNAFVFTVHEHLKSLGYAAEARYFHDGDTSYHLVDPGLILQLMQSLDSIIEQLRGLRDDLYAKAQEHKWSYCIADTHGEPAEPTTAGHWFLEKMYEVELCIEEFRHLRKTQLGVRRLSGTTGMYGMCRPDVEALALKHLGLRPVKVATQIISRTRHARIIAECAVTAKVIANIATTLSDMMSMYRRDMEEPARTKNKRGSSGMPHKKGNKIYTERLMGMPRLEDGYVIAALQNIVTQGWRKIEQSSVERVILPDAMISLHYMICTMRWLIQNLIVHPASMRKHLDDLQGLWATQSVLHALLQQGVDRDIAYDYLRDASEAALRGRIPLLHLLSNNIIPGTDGMTAAALIGHDTLVAFFDPCSRHQLSP